ncbi:MAG: UvrD-helicase domain-containing protein [Pirellulales bacterium]
MATAVDPNQVTASRTPYTPEQRRAVDTRDVSVALSAGAGCGKTFVLTERYLSHLEPNDAGAPNCDLSQLVAITFTDRAAREMRDRIRAKCFERLQQAPPEQGDYWLGLLRSLDSARVSTIHSFCGTLLRSHAVESELDPRFAVLEAAQAETLLAEQIDDLLRTKLAARHDDVLELVTQFGLARLREHLADLFDSCRSRDYHCWLARQPLELVERWAEFHRQHVVPGLARRVVECHGARRLLALLRENVFDHAELRERQEAILRLLPMLPQSSTLRADLEVIREQAKVVRSKKAWPSEVLKDQFRDAAKALRNEIDNVAGQLEFDAAACFASAELGLALLKLADEVHHAYDAAKAELAVLDFDDLLIRARRLLTDPNHSRVRERLAQDTRLLLVDECQDTDSVQVELIKALCGDQAAKRFVVGDYKQSIYRFRGADPSVFRKLQAETPERGQLPLNRNFRSQPAILQFVNALFCQALTSEELPYEPLTPHRDQTYAGPAIEFIWCLADHANGEAIDDPPEQPADNDSQPDESEPAGVRELRRREADWIARRICQFLTTEGCAGASALQIQDKASSQSRTVRKGDIAILFRSLSDVSYYEEALRSYGIDYYLVGGHAFYAQQEIYDVLNLLRSLVSQADEVSLAGVLRSPFFSLVDETLFWLAQTERGLWNSLCSERLSPAIDKEQQGRVKYAARVLQKLRARKDRIGIAELLHEALTRTGYDAALLGEFLGERKLANLRKLIAQARALDRTGVMSLSDFIVQLSQFVVRQPREPLAATHPEATDVVRLMTIHQSKGLEFPVVFVPDVGRRFNDHSSAARYSDDLGPLVRLPKDHEHARAVNGHCLHRLVSSAEGKAEAIRLFYVAATRAADFLVLSGGLKKLDGENGPWMQLLTERFDVSNGQLIASLPKGYATPQVRVLLKTPTIDVKRQAAHTSVDHERILREIEQAAVEQDGQVASSADPIPCDKSARRRFSVSRLLGTLEEPPSDGDVPQTWPSADGVATDAIELGVLVHAALATLDFHHAGDLAAHILLHADKLQVCNPATRDQALRLLEPFLESPRADQLRKAPQLFGEVEFLLAWPPVGVQAVGVQALACQPYLQGYLDCLYQDAAGRWHVVDYKTNQVSPSTFSDLVARYEMQMLAYGLAAEQALGEPIAELALHFLRTGAEHTFLWDDKARHRAVQLIDQAIAAICSDRLEFRL